MGSWKIASCLVNDNQGTAGYSMLECKLLLLIHSWVALNSLCSCVLEIFLHTFKKYNKQNSTNTSLHERMYVVFAPVSKAQACHLLCVCNVPLTQSKGIARWLFDPHCIGDEIGLVLRPGVCESCTRTPKGIWVV